MLILSKLRMLCLRILGGVDASDAKEEVDNWKTEKEQVLERVKEFILRVNYSRTPIEEISPLIIWFCSGYRLELTLVEKVRIFNQVLIDTAKRGNAWKKELLDIAKVFFSSISFPLRLADNQEEIAGISIDEFHGFLSNLWIHLMQYPQGGKFDQGHVIACESVQFTLEKIVEIAKGKGGKN